MKIRRAALRRGIVRDILSKLMITINQNWKAVLILLIPLFYQTIRKFIEEVEEAYGMKRRAIERATESAGDATVIEEEVPSITLGPHKFVTVRYSPVRRSRLGIHLEADSAIDVYTVTQPDLEKWKSRKDFTGSSFKRRKNIDIEYNSGPEFEDHWYLVLENASDDPIDVDYEVFER